MNNSAMFYIVSLMMNCVSKGDNSKALEYCDKIIKTIKERIDATK